MFGVETDKKMAERLYATTVDGEVEPRRYPESEVEELFIPPTTIYQCFKACVDEHTTRNALAYKRAPKVCENVHT